MLAALNFMLLKYSVGERGQRQPRYQASHKLSAGPFSPRGGGRRKLGTHLNSSRQDTERRDEKGKRMRDPEHEK